MNQTNQSGERTTTGMIGQSGPMGGMNNLGMADQQGMPQNNQGTGMGFPQGGGQLGMNPNQQGMPQNNQGTGMGFPQGGGQLGMNPNQQGMPQNNQGTGMGFPGAGQLGMNPNQKGMPQNNQGTGMGFPQAGGQLGMNLNQQGMPQNNQGTGMGFPGAGQLGMNPNQQGMPQNNQGTGMGFPQGGGQLGMNPNQQGMPQNNQGTGMGFPQGAGQFGMPSGMNPQGVMNNPHQQGMSFPLGTMQPGMNLPGMTMTNSTAVQYNQISSELSDMKGMLEKLNRNCEQMKRLMGSNQGQDEFEELNQKYKKLKQDSENIVELQMKYDNLQKKLKTENDQNDVHEETIKKLKLNIQELERQLQEQKKQSQKNLLELQEDFDIQKLKFQSILQENSISTNNSSAYQLQIDELTKQIKKLRNENKDLEEQNEQLKASDQGKQIFDLQLVLHKMKVDYEEEHNKFLMKLDEIAEYRRKVQARDKDIKIKDESIGNFSSINKNLNLKLKEKDQQIQNLKEQTQSKDEYSQELNTYILKLRDQLLNQKGSDDKSANQKLIDEMNKLQKKNEEKKQKQEQDLIKLQEEMKQNEINKKLLIENELKQQEESRQDRIKRAELVQKKMQESHGQAEVCFLVDCTGSMDSYKQQTMMSISGSMQAIKTKTGRDVKWSTVCYQDYEEKAVLPGNQYHQLNFTKQPEQLEQFLQKISCSGGGDASEDIRGGIIQMCQTVSWEKPFRVAILICDAPSHGINTNGGCGDNHPNDDMKDSILMLIKYEIMFVGLNFTIYTKQMYAYIEQIFKENNRGDLFTLVDMVGVNSDQIWKEMVTRIVEATVSITKTNKKETQSKGDKPTDAPKTKDGAIEALCKAGNFYDFETQKELKIVDTKFKVIRVDIKEESFKTKLENIQLIQVPEDYEVHQEGIWDCFRTEKPFAFGMMKAVYLMKKKNATKELYVIKTPLGGKTYSTLNAAITECRSHLVCQKLMKKFTKEVNDACDEAENLGQPVKRYPQIVYSDFLILEENPNSFWIAERFFNGEFIKYNNNYGYINDDQTQLNQMAQAFSYYTFHVSNLKYMVNDVQGVGTYFTDPAINTLEGNFDETDMGEVGQSMFMVNFQVKKSICLDILRLVKIYQR